MKHDKPSTSKSSVHGVNVTPLTAASRLHTTASIAVNVPSSQEIREENARFRQLLHDVTRSLDSEWRTSGCAITFVRRLRDLRDQLVTHFALEEAYGYFDGAVDVAPQLSRRADSLRGEHPTLFAQIHDLAKQAEALAYDAVSCRALQDIAARTRVFCEQLRRHEHRENDLILQSFYEDVGVGD